MGLLSDIIKTGATAFGGSVGGSFGAGLGGAFGEMLVGSPHKKAHKYWKKQYAQTRKDFLADRDWTEQAMRDRYMWLEAQQEPTKMGSRELQFQEAAYPGTNPWERLGVQPQVMPAASERGSQSGRHGDQLIGSLAQLAGSAMQGYASLAGSLESASATRQAAGIGGAYGVKSSEVSAGASVTVADINAAVSEKVANIQADASRYGSRASSAAAALGHGPDGVHTVLMASRDLYKGGPTSQRLPMELRKMEAEAGLTEIQQVAEAAAAARAEERVDVDIIARKFGFLGPFFHAYYEALGGKMDGTQPAAGPSRILGALGTAEVGKRYLGKAIDILLDKWLQKQAPYKVPKIPRRTPPR